MVYWCRNIKLWISHCLIVGVQVTSEADVICHKSNVKPSRATAVYHGKPHGSSSTWFQTSCYRRAELNSYIMNTLEYI